MHKNFEARNLEKQNTEARTDSSSFYANPQEVWYAKLGVNIGNETDGKNMFERPVLILAKVGSVFWILPMTTKGKCNQFYHRIGSIHFGKPSFAMLSQVRTIDKKRLMYPIGTISKQEFESIKKSLLQFLQ